MASEPSEQGPASAPPSRPPASNGQPPVTEGEQAAPLRAALVRWRTELSGLQGPSPLFGSGTSDADGLHLAHAHPSGIASFLAGRPTRLSHLFREPGAFDHAREAVRAIRATAATLADEHGLRACVLAVGLASWREGDDRAAPPVSTPVLLRPIELRPRGSGDFELDLGGPVRTNPALLRELRRRGVSVDPEELARLAQRQQGFDPTPTLERLRAATRTAAPGVEVRASLLITALVDVAPALVADLERVAGRLEDSEPVRALAGDAAARHRLAGADERRRVPTSPPVLDQVRVLPLDADQRRVVSGALAGASLRVETGPGTGATQLAAATIAALVGAGRSVLVVPGQQSEVADVAARLEPLGLSHVVTGAEAAPRVRRGGGPDGDGSASRSPAAALAEAGRDLHAPRAPWGVSVLDAFNALTRLEQADDAPSTPVVLPREVLMNLGTAERDAAADMLAEVADLGALTPSADGAPWWGADLSDASDAETALATVAELRAQLLPDLRSQVKVMARATGLREPASVAEAASLLHLMLTVRSTLDLFTPHVYERSVTDLAETLAPRSERPEDAPRVGLLARRRAERAAQELVRPGTVVPDLHRALVAADASRRGWLSWQLTETAGALPVVPRGLPQTQALCDAALADLGALAPALATTPGGGELLAEPWDAVVARLAALEADAASLDTLPRRTTLLVRLRAAGLDPLVEDLRSRGTGSGAVRTELERCWWTSLLEIALDDSPSLRDAGGDGRARLVAQVARAEDVRADAAVRAVAEAASRRSRRGGRSCRVISPLAITHDLPPGASFDVVVFLAAHRLGVPEAVLAMATASQVIAIGDPVGVPVAPFTTRQGEVPPRGQRQSLLDAAAGALPTAVLGRQHRMTTTLTALAEPAAGSSVGAAVAPSVPWATSTRAAVVDAGPSEDPVGRSAAFTARVVKVMAEHARQHPDESLAVVALTRPEARAVADAVRTAYRSDAVLRDFLVRAVGERGERFVVTDVARSGDTVRDAVIVSAGELPRPAGDAGPRDVSDLLAVALTRARSRVALVATSESVAASPALAAVASDAGRDAATATTLSTTLSTSRSTPPEEPLLVRWAADLGDDVTVVTSPVPGIDLLVTSGALPGCGVAVLGDLTAGPSVSDPPPGSRGPSGGRRGGDVEELAVLVQRELELPGELAAAGWSTVRVGAVELFADPTAATRRVREALAGMPASSA